MPADGQVRGPTPEAVFDEKDQEGATLLHCNQTRSLHLNFILSALAQCAVNAALYDGGSRASNDLSPRLFPITIPPKR